MDSRHSQVKHCLQVCLQLTYEDVDGEEDVEDDGAVLPRPLADQGVGEVADLRLDAAQALVTLRPRLLGHLTRRSCCARLREILGRVTRKLM